MIGSYSPNPKATGEFNAASIQSRPATGDTPISADPATAVERLLAGKNHKSG